MIAVATSHADQAIQIFEVAEQTFNLRKSLSLSDLDARSVALDNMQMIAEASQINLSFFHNWATGSESEKEFVLKILNITTRSQELVDRYGYALRKTAKLAHVTFSLFQVEHLLRGLARELKISAADDGIFQLTSKLLTNLSLPKNLQNCILAMANIRNSQHNNGIFHKPAKLSQDVFIIDNETFAFNDRKPVDCADWEHVAHIQKAILRTLGEILTTSAVLAIQDPMLEAYANSKQIPAINP